MSAGTESMGSAGFAESTESEHDRFSADQFRDPPATYRPVPIWFWNGDLDEAEVRRQVREMAAQGLGGCQIAARQGLTTPYLSDEWFRLVAAASDEAQRHGIEVWLADEYPYPSGVSGGEVIQRHLEYRAWRLDARRVTARPGQVVRCMAPGAVLLTAAAVPVEGSIARWDRALDLRAHAGLSHLETAFAEPAGAYLTTKRYGTYKPRPTVHWRVPNSTNSPDTSGSLGTPNRAGTPDKVDSWEIWLVAAAEVEGFKYFDGYVDLCNADAVRCFLETTHERYAARLGADGLRRLTGFFLDEGHPPSWSWRLPAAFHARTGYELAPALPALWTDVGARTAQVRYDYWQTLTELFVESFHRPVAAWCDQHGLKLALEVDSTRNVVQRYAHVPGGDPGHEKAGTPLDEIRRKNALSYRMNPTFAASLAAQVGRRRVLGEVFHSVGWSMTLQDMKAMADRLAAEGTNAWVPHAFAYSIGGLRKWDAPPSQFDQNPYWRHYRRFADYTGRLAYALSRGRRVSPVAMVDPITSLWAHGGQLNKRPDVGGGPDGMATRIASDWRYLLTELPAAQVAFDTLDPLLLMEGEIARDPDGRAELRIGWAAYRVVVLPPMSNLETAAWEKLEAFAAAGGAVVACGLLPYEQIDLASDVPARCAARFGVNSAALRRAYEGTIGGDTPGGDTPGVTRNDGFVLVRSAGSLAQTNAAPQLLTVLDELSPPILRLHPGGDAARRGFVLAQRRLSDGDLFFVSNATAEEHECRMELRTELCRTPGGPARVFRLDLEDGGWQALHPVASADGSTATLQLRFAAHESHLLLVRSAAPSPAESAGDDTGRSTTGSDTGVRTRTLRLSLDGEWACALGTDNALRLDRFRFAAVQVGDRGEDAPRAMPPGVGLADAPLVEPMPLVNVLQQLERAGLAWPVACMHPVRIDTSFGGPPRFGLQLPLALWYRAEFEVVARPTAAVLCLEAPVLRGEWALWLNGHLLTEAELRPRRRWDVTNREAEVSSLLRLGTNEVVVRVIAQQPSDGLVDALYLLGNFGVRRSREGTLTVGETPRRIRWNHRHEDGLPFYAGALTLTKTIGAADPDGETMVHVPDGELLFAGVAALRVNGSDLDVRPWTPYQWRVPPGVLRGDVNEVALTLTTTLAELLEGRRYAARERRLVAV